MRAKNSLLAIALIISLDLVPANRVLADGVYHFITGYVRDSLGNPIAGVNVAGDDYVGDELPSIPSDENGFFSVDAGTEGNYRLTINCVQLSARGFRCVDPVAITVSSENTAYDFTLSPADFQVTNTFLLPRGNVGLPYTLQLGAIGGQEPYTWQLASGSTNLPAGLSLSSSGLISGVPATNSTASIKVQVTDANLTVTNKSHSLTINPKPILSAPLWLTNRFTLRLTGASNQNYTIQMATNMNAATWTSLMVTNNLKTNSYLVVDPRATNGSRFYRVMIGP